MFVALALILEDYHTVLLKIWHKNNSYAQILLSFQHSSIVYILRPFIHSMMTPAENWKFFHHSVKGIE